MVDLVFFRQTLAASLRDWADRRRGSAGGVLTGEDLKVIALFERLAADAQLLDGRALLSGDDTLTHELCARRFSGRRDALLAQVGVTYAPKDAADLVGWMHRQAPQPDAADGVGPPTEVAADLRDRLVEREQWPGGAIALANDFCAGFGIVAPMLAVWEVAQGVRQSRDRSFAASHPSAQASVVSVKPIGGDRDPGRASQVVLVFQPSPVAGACQVSVRIGAEAAAPEPGTTMAVVPRSADCEPPLLPAALPDPTVTIALAAALMAGGLVALRCWGRLMGRRRSTRGTSHSLAWPRPGAVRAGRS